MRYVITEFDVASRSVAAVRTEVPFGRVPEFFGACLDQVYAVGRRGAVPLDGQNIFIYHRGGPGSLVVDFGVGTVGKFAAIDNVTWRETPAGRVASTVHWGDYGGLRAAHDAVLQWCLENSLRLAGPSWEVYGHWNDDPAKLRTDIFYLLRPPA